MVRTNRAQREALFKVFQRDFPGWITPTKRVKNLAYKDWSLNQLEHFPHLIAKVPSIQYRRFRKTVQPFFGGDCVMVPWAGMWLGIEKDGYTHS